MSLASYHCSTPGYKDQCSILRERALFLCGRFGACCRGRRSCSSGGGQGGRFGLAAAMPLEYARRRKFAQLVADHVFCNKQPDELLAVMNHEGVADEIGNHRAIARPGLDRLASAALVHAFDAGQQAWVYIRSLFQRSAHRFIPLLFWRKVRSGTATSQDRGVGRLPFLPRLSAFVQLARGSALVP